ncbi:MAG: alpha/beta hydrolase [Candidatus Cloacimonetes bacterium]|nr:alpha/beta hydrolase [Candidatus Cloacimonadota bacterium]
MKKIKTLVLLFCLVLLSISGLYSSNSQYIGFWIGAIRVMDTELEIHLEISEKDDQFIGLLSIPQQLQKDLEVYDLDISFPEIEFKLDVGTIAAFSGIMQKGYISGTFSQAGVNGLFHLIRGEKSVIRDSSIEFGPLEGETEISVDTNKGILYGSLVIPDREAEFPLVIIVAGSGPTDRDGNNPLISGKGYFYRQIAEELRNTGIATLRYDKRGVGKSREAHIDEIDLKIDNYVLDIINWLELLKEDLRFSSIILFGHSEGSLLSILAAQREEVSGLISAAGAGRDMADVLLEQFARQPEPYKSEGEDIISSLRRGQEVPEVSKELYPVFRPQIQPYLISQMQINPSSELSELDIPILIIQGTTDLQVGVEDAQILASSNPKADLMIIDNMNHVFRSSSMNMQENISTYGDPDLPLSDGFIMSIIEFINKLR